MAATPLTVHRTIDPEQAKDLSRLAPEADAVHGADWAALLVGENLGQLAGFDHAGSYSQNASSLLVTRLRKSPVFRTAFFDFDPARIAAKGETYITDD